MPKFDIPEFIETILAPSPPKAQGGRKVWSIDLENVLLPFFYATNTVGKTAIPSVALGAPLRLAYNLDGTVKINERTGKPVVRVAKELQDQVKLMRQNYEARLLDFAEKVRKTDPEGYKQEIKLAMEAGEPIRNADKLAVQKLAEQAEAMKQEALAVS